MRVRGGGSSKAASRRDNDSLDYLTRDSRYSINLYISQVLYGKVEKLRYMLATILQLFVI